MCLMMLFLAGDVLHNLGHVRFTDAKHSISGLPCELPIPFRPHPFGRVCLNHTSDLRCRLSRPNTNQKMHMIGSPIDDQCCPLHFADDAAKLSKQIGTERSLDQNTPPLGAPNEMQQNVAGCMRQGLSPPLGLLASFCGHPRLSPCAAFFRRYAASL